jgi:hypothetical protein
MLEPPARRKRIGSPAIEHFFEASRMPYVAEIARDNPTCILVLTDQSASMQKPFGRQPDRRKCDGVAEAVNQLVYNLVMKCARDNGIREYCQVAILGYGGAQIGSAFGGVLAGRNLVPIGEIANNPLRVEERDKAIDDGAGGVVHRKVKVPVWFEPQASGKTPMAQALALGSVLARQFVQRYPNCFPPVVINISDGIPDSDPRPQAKELTQVASSDGAALLFNVHISDKPDMPIEFPANESPLPDNHAKLLFRMSSVLPQNFQEAAVMEGYAMADKSRGFVFNADLSAVVKFLDIGTRGIRWTPAPS